jgi:HlyD family secretion protein
MSQTRSTKTNHQTRRWIPYAGAILLVALIVAGLWPKPVPVETTRVSIGALRATVNEEGKTRIKQRYIVSAPVGGQLRRIPFKAGAEIKAGDIVAVIEPVSAALLDARTRSTAEAKRDTALANREKARASSTLAANELRRAEKLYADTTISIQELENFKMRADSTTNELAATEGALRQAEAELAEFPPGGDSAALAKDPPCEIKAPVSGRVLRVFEENARAVPAGTELLEIGDPADLEVVVEVLSRDGAMIAPGAPVEFDQWGGGEPLLGRVRLVEPAAFTKVSALGVEEQRVNVVADLVTPPEQRRNVGDKFRVDARIVVWEARDALKVPVGALFRQGDQWATFVVTDGRARLRLVKAGRSSGTETQVLEGLKEGEEVILYPGSRVRDGERVRAIKI